MRERVGWELDQPNGAEMGDGIDAERLMETPGDG